MHRRRRPGRWIWLPGPERPGTATQKSSGARSQPPRPAVVRGRPGRDSL